MAMAAHLLGGASCAHRAMRPPVGRQCCLPAASSLRHDSGSHQLGRRLQRRNGDPAVEPAAALGAAAAERNASSSGPSLLQHAPSSSSNNHSSSSSSTTLGMPCRQQRLRVAVDVDEVLGRFLHSLNKFCLEAYGLEYNVADYWVYDFAKIWGCAPDESNQRVHEFFRSRHFAAGIETIPGAYEALQRLRPACDLVVVTSRQHCIQAPTLHWLDRHFPQVFTEVHFGNHFALEGASKKKSEICRAIGAEVLVDDNPAYALECAQAGIQVLLYDWQHAYPWSKTADGPSHHRITRVRDWAEVEQVLGVLAAQRSAA